MEQANTVVNIRAHQIWINAAAVVAGIALGIIVSPLFFILGNLFAALILFLVICLFLGLWNLVDRRTTSLIMAATVLIFLGFLGFFMIMESDTLLNFDFKHQIHYTEAQATAPVFLDQCRPDEIRFVRDSGSEIEKWKVDLVKGQAEVRRTSITWNMPLSSDGGLEIRTITPEQLSQIKRDLALLPEPIWKLYAFWPPSPQSEFRAAFYRDNKQLVYLYPQDNVSLLQSVLLLESLPVYHQ